MEDKNMIVKCKMHGHLTELPCDASGCPFFEDCLAQYEEANGATVQNGVPITERLPEEREFDG